MGCTGETPCTGPSDEVRPIGTATMEEGGTIVLDLTARSGSTRGHARFTYPPDHERYDEIIEHLGGLRPGQEKPVPPWPEDPRPGGERP